MTVVTNRVESDSPRVSNESRFIPLQIVAYILYGLGPIVGNVILVLQSSIASQYQVPNIAVLAGITAFQIPYAIIQLFSGTISDLKGRMPVITIGLICFGVGNTLAATSFALEMFIIANALCGVGFGLINPALIALVTDFTAGPNIPAKMGSLGAVATLGVGLGPLIGGLLVGFGWQVFYIVFAALTIACLVAQFVVRRPVQNPSQVKGLRDLLSQFSIEWRRPIVILMMVAAFLIAETYIAIIIMTSTAVAGSIAPGLWGSVLLVAGAAGAVISVIAGIISKKFGPQVALWTGCAAVFTSLIMLLSIGDVRSSSNLPDVALAMVFASIAGGAIFPTITSYSQTLSPSKRGALAGSMAACYFIGIALVPSLYTPLLNLGLTLVYTSILFVAIAMFIVVTILFLTGKRVKPQIPPTLE